MTTTFFRFIWRFNALAIAAVSVVAGFVGLYAAYHIAREVFARPFQVQDIARVEPASTVAGGTTPIRTEFSLGRFAAIQGTSILWSSKFAMQEYDYGSSSKEAGSTRNILFYDAASGISRKLLADDTRLIVEWRELRADGELSTAAPQALAYRVIEKDRNGDGILSHSDGSVTALSRVSGEGYTVVEGSHGKSLGEIVRPGGRELIVMVETEDGVKALHVDLATFVTTKTGTIGR